MSQLIKKQKQKRNLRVPFSVLLFQPLVLHGRYPHPGGSQMTVMTVFTRVTPVVLTAVVPQVDVDRCQSRAKVEQNHESKQKGKN